MESYENTKASWVGMVMDRMHALEEQAQHQQKLIRDVQEKFEDGLRITTQDPFLLLAASIRWMLGSRPRRGVEVVYLPTQANGVRQIPCGAES